jgi:hypothetical protein
MAPYHRKLLLVIIHKDASTTWTAKISLSFVAKDGLNLKRPATVVGGPVRWLVRLSDRGYIVCCRAAVIKLEVFVLRMWL